MNQPAQILVAYDFSDTAELALQHALNLAKEDSSREFHFLVVLDRNRGLGLRSDEDINYEYAEEVQEIATNRISGAIDKMGGGKVEMLVHVRLGDPAKQILGLAHEIGASLIVLGSHGRTGVKRMLLGSVSESVVREALCPFMVARARTYLDVERAKVVEVDKDESQYVKPHRYHYDTGMPTHDKTWALY